MSAALTRRWFQEVWNERREATIDALFAADGVGYGLPGQPRGPEGFRVFWRDFLRLFPDLQLEVHDAVESPPDAEGTVTVASRFTARGTHAPTGRAASFPAMCFARWREGKITEAWNVVDFFGLQEQLGAPPF
ncbi:MAG: ester cyclase [Planctomycetes bacterium]|nr:ester cyclase [Planctomycetota bacterium]